MESLKYKIFATIEIGYLALAVCALTTLSIEESIDRIVPETKVNKYDRRRWGNEEIIKLRNEGKTWPEIGCILKINPNTAYRRAKRHREKTGGRINEL